MERELELRITHIASDRPCCDGCGASAPETNTDYTLISRSFGWRLTRRKLPTGALTMEWRCATCWKKYKGERAALPSTVAPAPRLEGSRSSRPPRDIGRLSSPPPLPARLAGGLR